MPAPEFVRKLIQSGIETTKLEHKLRIDIHSNNGKAELIKDVLAMANASPSGEDTGYLIIGSSNGIAEDISDLKLDDATLQQIVNSKVHPPIAFSYTEIVTQTGVTVGVIEIPKSNARPHCVKQDIMENERVLLHKGKCLIRQGSSTKEAMKEDFDQMYDEYVDSERRNIMNEAFEYVQRQGAPKDKKPTDLEHVTSATPKEISATVTELLRQDDTIGITSIVNNLRGQLITKWKDTVDKSEEEVTTIKHTFIKPIISMLTALGALFVVYDAQQPFKEVLDAFASIYELANDVSYGRQPSMTTKEHLSWTVPSKETMKSLYTVGSVAAFKGRAIFIRLLLDRKITATRYFTSVEPILAHPLFEYSSGEGDYTVFFEEARNETLVSKQIFEYFDTDKEKLTTAFCNFDFLVMAALIQENPKTRMFPNFARYYRSRIEPLISRISTDSKSYVTILGNNPPAAVDACIEKVNELAAREPITLMGWGVH